MDFIIEVVVLDKFYCRSLIPTGPLILEANQAKT